MRQICSITLNYVAKGRGLIIKTAIIYHEDFRKYDFGSHHPFRGSRYQSILQVIGHEAIKAKSSELTFVKPKPAPDEEIRAVHGADYIDFLESLNEKGGILTLDTPIRPGLYNIAKLFAGANILAGRLIAENIFQRAVVLGLGAHHAGFDFGGGFCLINDIAVMIEYLRSHCRIKKILVIDYDAHCGDGTQNIYYYDPHVLCLDFHQDPLSLYPGKGFPEQIGLKGGKGYTVNIAFPPGASDNDYIRVFNEIFVPIAIEFHPEIIVANGGLDAHFLDPLSQLSLSLRGYFQIMSAIVTLSKQICNGKVILILGGGYEPRVLALGWLAMIAAMLEVKEIDLPEPVQPPVSSGVVSKQVNDMIGRVKKIQKKYWKYLI